MASTRCRPFRTPPMRGRSSDNPQQAGRLGPRRLLFARPQLRRRHHSARLELHGRGGTSHFEVHPVDAGHAEASAEDEAAPTAAQERPVSPQPGADRAVQEGGRQPVRQLPPGDPAAAVVLRPVPGDKRPGCQDAPGLWLPGHSAVPEPPHQDVPRSGSQRPWDGAGGPDPLLRHQPGHQRMDGHHQNPQRGRGDRLLPAASHHDRGELLPAGPDHQSEPDGAPEPADELPDAADAFLPPAFRGDMHPPPIWLDPLLRRFRFVPGGPAVDDVPLRPQSESPGGSGRQGYRRC